MHQLANPGTSPRTGDRSRASRVSPRNITGRRYAELHAEKAAREAARSVDIETIKRVEFEKGFNAGHESGWESLTTALHGLYRSEGIGAVQEFLDELDDAGKTEESGE